jgi:diaminohydroxyphosphoribosylaminopyrimidine deaminase/5-amino-6-(5-phosphoribosylamino)uracil reductase
MTDEHYMQRCLELARIGLGNVAPNPMVGSVIVHHDIIIGEGFHEKYGEAHAEVNAINAVSDHSLLKESTLYVNLEPCAHFGKTPPCANLIIEKGIKRVVVGCIDSFSEVAGKGIRRLQDAGIEVTVGVLETESLEINKRFFTFHNKKRPYLILKWAQSKDGFIDIARDNNEKGIHWITQKETKQLVHKWRSEEAGILVGKNTVLNDNPELTVREVEGASPARFVIDSQDSLDLSQFKIGNSKAITYKIVSKNEHIDVSEIVDFIFTKEIQSVIIEGGKITLEQFINEDIWDEARVLTGNSNLYEGVKAPTLKTGPVRSINYGEDLIQIYRNA